MSAAFEASGSRRDGVLLTAHGTVEDLGDLPAFLLRIRHGRPAPPELLAELERRYRAIGGSPLLQTSRKQAVELSRELSLPVFLGMRLWRPELREALIEARAQGVQRLCVLPLAPFSVHVYASAAERALKEVGGGLALVAAAPFGRDSSFVEAQAEAILPALSGRSDELLVLTAHSLPASVIRGGDPYAEQVDESAQAIGARLGRPFTLAYQSQGADGGEWLGPGLRDVLSAAKSEGRRRVVVAPFGFLSDHVETLYDLDVEASGWARELGLEFSRVPALNTAHGLIVALAEAARRALFG